MRYRPLQTLSFSLNACSQVVSIKGDGATALGLAVRHLLPGITKLELHVVEFSSQLLESLCTGAAPIKLQELIVVECLEDSQLLPTLGQLQHLRVLRFWGDTNLEGSQVVSSLARLRGLQELRFGFRKEFEFEPIGLGSVLRACTQLRVLTVPLAHHITPELCFTSLTELTCYEIIMSKPFLLDVGRLPSLRVLRVESIILCESAEQGRLPQSGDTVEKNARMLSSLPAAVEVEFGYRGEFCLWLISSTICAREWRCGAVLAGPAGTPCRNASCTGAA